MSARQQKRSDYRHFRTIPTRWMDNDIYGHVYVDRQTNQPVPVPAALRAVLATLQV